MPKIIAVLPRDIYDKLTELVEDCGTTRPHLCSELLCEAIGKLHAQAEEDAEAVRREQEEVYYSGLGDATGRR